VSGIAIDHYRDFGFASVNNQAFFLLGSHCLDAYCPDAEETDISSFDLPSETSLNPTLHSHDYHGFFKTDRLRLASC
jgi:hypothetical protein